jgi:hypothetical protein
MLRGCSIHNCKKSQGECLQNLRKRQSYGTTDYAKRFTFSQTMRGQDANLENRGVLNTHALSLAEGPRPVPLCLLSRGGVCGWNWLLQACCCGGKV